MTTGMWQSRHVTPSSANLVRLQARTVELWHVPQILSEASTGS